MHFCRGRPIVSPLECSQGVSLWFDTWRPSAAVERSGFDRLVAALSAGQVGAVSRCLAARTQRPLLAVGAVFAGTIFLLGYSILALAVAKMRGVRFGRKPKLSGYQAAEAMQRREAGETLPDIGV